MTNKPKAIGTRCETAVVNVLRLTGFPHAERRALRGAQDAGDITGTPGICWSVKGGDRARDASDAQVFVWLAELDKQRVNARADVGVLVMQRRAVGPANAGRWWAVVTSHTLTVLNDPAATPGENAPNVPVRLTLASVLHLLRWAGYGSAAELSTIEGTTC